MIGLPVRKEKSGYLLNSTIAPTGLLLDAAPYGAMLALAAGSGLVFFRKRRRED